MFVLIPGSTVIAALPGIRSQRNDLQANQLPLAPDVQQAMREDRRRPRWILKQLWRIRVVRVFIQHRRRDEFETVGRRLEQQQLAVLAQRHKVAIDV